MRILFSGVEREKNYFLPVFSIRGRPLLHFLACSSASSSSDPMIFYFLWQDVDMMDQNGMTPLMWAAYRTHRCVCLYSSVFLL